MRSALPVILVTLLVLPLASARWLGVGSSELAARSGFDLEFGDMVVPSDQVTVLENISVLVRGSLIISGTLELRNSSLILSEEGLADHSVTGTLKLVGHPSSGAGSLMEARCPSGSAQVPLGVILSVNSTIRNISFYGGDVSVSGSRLSNCTLDRPEQISHLSGNTFTNGPKRAALGLSAANWEIAGNTIRDYGQGIFSYGGGLRLSSMSFEGCPMSVLKLGPDDGAELRLEDVRAVNSSFSISRWGTMTVIGSDFIGGRIEMSGRPAYLHSSSFLDHEGVMQMTGGLVNGCTFMNSSIGLDTPVRSTITRSRFISCGTAIWDDRDCEIFHNVFKGNAHIVEGFVQSLWYNTTMKEGNHYDSYMGLDNGQNGRQMDDGIGDTEIPFMGRDYYPLLKDGYWLFPQIPSISFEHEAGGSLVSLSWADQKDLDYMVQCTQEADFKKVIAIYSASDSPLIVRSPGNGTYLYRVGAWNELGSRGWSVPVSVQVDQRPLPPGRLKALPVSEGQGVMLTWEWVGEDLYGASVHYSMEGGDELLGSVVHPESSLTIGELENGRTYLFSMMSVDNKGQRSDMTASVEAMPMDTVPPPPPTSVSASPMDNNGISIRWDPPSNIYYPDLSGFLLYRKGPLEGDFDLIHSFPRGVLYYEDVGLEDNTTYSYFLRSVDDDGPISEPSEVVLATTLHYNSAPIFIGGTEVIYLVEDAPPSVFDIMRWFSDPDGDKLLASVTDSFPFPSEMKDGLLNLYQGSDQSGNGYIQLMVTDGEAFETFLLGVYIEPSDDPPSEVSIQSPVNGSVLIPGSLTLLEGYAFDPDVMYEGDTLTFAWYSDLDGVLSGPGLSVPRMRVQLSPGPHVLTLRVTDSTGASVSVQVKVMVSLWGWGEQPWYIDMDNSTTPLTTGGGSVRVVLMNNGPLFLTFECTVTLLWGNLNTTIVRTSVAPPMDRGLLVVNAPSGLPPGTLTVRVEASGYTLNGSYAGGAKASFTKEVVEERTETVDPTAFLLLSGAVALVLVIATAYVVFLLLTSRKGKGKRPYGAEDVRGRVS